MEGDESLTTQLIIRLDTLMLFMKNSNNIINKTLINSMLSGNGKDLIRSSQSRLILHGVGKKPIKAHTINQIKIVEAFENNDMVFAIGPAGTGKTYTGIAG